MAEITIKIFFFFLIFCLRFVFSIFYTGSQQVPPKKNHLHLKCQLSPKIPIFLKSLLYKHSKKWLSPLPSPRGAGGGGGGTNYDSLNQPKKPENQNFEKRRKAAGDVIILILCNKKHDQMMYLDMECNRHNFFVILGQFLFFHPTVDTKN